MIKARFVLCAETVVHDRDSNSMSAIQIMENVSAPGFPVLLHRLATLAVFEREAADPGKATLSFRLTLNDKELIRQDLEVQFNGNGLINRTTVRFVGLVIEGPGIFKASFYQEDRQLGFYEIKFESIPQPGVISDSASVKS